MNAQIAAVGMDAEPPVKQAGQDLLPTAMSTASVTSADGEELTASQVNSFGAADQIFFQQKSKWQLRLQAKGQAYPSPLKLNPLQTHGDSTDVKMATMRQIGDEHHGSGTLVRHALRLRY